MDRNAIENYNKIKVDAEAVLAAADYTPHKMLWECWRGLENPPAKKILTDATGRQYIFTAVMVNFGVYDLHVTKEGEHSRNIYSFCDR
jgi:hypothetical protein